MRSDIAPGGISPDYELPDHTGKLRKISELQGDDPPILTLARGHYCPKEHQQHLELAAFYPKIAVATLKSQRSPLTIAILSRIFAHQWGLSGHFFQILTESSRKISTSRSTPIPSTTR